MNNSLTDIHQLRNDIDFASIAQFFHTFQSAFRPWPVTTHDIIYSRILDANDYVFETEDLERMILEPSERIRLEDLMVRMLRLVTGKRFINSSTWQSHFSKEFDKREFDQENPMINYEQLEQGEKAADQQIVKDEKEEKDEAAASQPTAPITESTVPVETKKDHSIDYFTLPLDTRVHLLHLLCEWQLDEPDKFREHLDNEEEAIQWRVDPVGFDRKGSTFWLFDDNRLYKETPKPKASRKKGSTTTNKRKRGMPPPAPPTKDAPITRRSSRRNQPPPPPPPPPVSTRGGGRGKKTIEVEEEEEESEDEGEWMPWKLVCLSKQDWEQLPLKYANSKNLDEIRFHTLLVGDLIPKIIPVLEEREKEIKKQEALMHRKRSSRIMIKELEALERASSSFDGEPMAVEAAVAIHSPKAELHDKNKSRASNRLERKNLEKEQREQELAAKAREERALERERRIMEREYRALLREKRQEGDEENGEPLPSFEVFMHPELAHVAAEASGSTTRAGDASTAGGQEENKLTVKDKKEKKTTKKTKKGDKKGEKEKKPRKKYEKKPKFDENGNPIPKKPRKPKLDEFGNPIPLKKRGRKPKNKDLDEDNWIFDCSGCGISGKNLDDGTPMIACEKCGVWQHIACLENSGQVEKNKSLDDITFVCHKCENDQQVDIDGDQEEEQPVYKKQRLEYNGGAESMEYQHTDPAAASVTSVMTNTTLPPIQQSSWQQPSAVRGGGYNIQPPIHNGNSPYQMPSVLPPIRTPIQQPQQQQYLAAGIYSSALSYKDTSTTTTTVSSPSSTLAEPPTPISYHNNQSPSPSPRLPPAAAAASYNKPSPPVIHHQQQQQSSSYYSSQEASYTEQQQPPAAQHHAQQREYNPSSLNQQQPASIPYTSGQTAPVSTPPPQLPSITTPAAHQPATANTAVVTAPFTQPIQAMAAPTPPPPVVTQQSSAPIDTPLAPTTNITSNSVPTAAQKDIEMHEALSEQPSATTSVDVSQQQGQPSSTSVTQPPLPPHTNN